MPDLFLSYSRRDKAFVQTLYDALKTAGRDIWVDWEDIPPSADWLAEVYSGIEESDAFVCVLSPDYAASEVCAKEVAHAVALHKRLIPIVRHTVEPHTLPDAVGSHNWLFIREEDDFARGMTLLQGALDTDLEWVREHTRLLTRALEWERGGRSDGLVLRGEELRKAESWLAKAGAGLKPHPTPLQAEYVLTSRRADTRRQRQMITSLSAGIAFTALLAVLAVYQTFAARRERDRAQELLYVANMSLISPAWENSDHERVTQLLTGTRNDPRRGPEWGLWERRFFPARATCNQHDGPAIALALSPNGKMILTGSDDRTARLWDTATGQELQRLEGHTTSVTAVAFSPDGGTLATRDTGGTTRYWDTATGKPTTPPGGFPPPVPLPTTPFAAAPGGALVATALPPDPIASTAEGQVDPTPDFRIRLKDAAGRVVGMFEGHDGPVTSLAFSPDGKTLLSGSRDHTARLWDVATRREVGRLLGHFDDVTAVLFSRDGQTIATTSADGSAKLWDATRREPLPLAGNGSRAVTGAAFSPDGSWIVTTGRDGQALVFDTATGARRHTLSTGHTSGTRRVAVSPDGHRIAVTTDAVNTGDPIVHLFNADSGREVQTLPRGAGKTGPSQVFALRFSPDGTYLAAGCDTGEVTVWNAATGKERITFAGTRPDAPQPGVVNLFLSPQVIALAFSPDGTRIAVGGADGAARVFDASTGKELLQLPGERMRYDAVAFTHDGRYLATGTHRGLTFWDTATGKMARQFTGSAADVGCLDFSPDGTRVATGSADGTLRLWDVATGRELLRTRSAGRINAVAVSPDGTRFVTAHSAPDPLSPPVALLWSADAPH